MAATQADTTILAAFAVGFVSFISPCVLPLVPGYLSAVSGVSVAEMQTGERRLSKILLPAIIFCLSFTVMFVALGLFFVATPFVPVLNKEWRPDALIRRAGSGGPVVAGAAFAVAWTPCVGPTLGAILTAASTSASVGHGGVLLAFYSLGLAVPFLLCAVAFDRASIAFRWLRDRYLWVTAISGVILIVMGILVFTGEITRLNAEVQKFLSDIGLNFIYSI